MFANLIGFSAYTYVEGDSFYKEYDNIDDHWLRIRNAAVFLSREDLGPKVISINDDLNLIQYERVTPFNNDSKPIILRMSISDIRNAINSLVNKLHSLGYGHGDLHIENIGFKDNKIYILDHDTIYKIEDLYNGKAEWLVKWMLIGFEWDASLEDFVNNDYETWNSDWLYEES